MSVPVIRKINNAHKIKILKGELKYNKKLISNLEKELEDVLPIQESLEKKRELEILLNRCDVLKQKLQEIGYKDPRGRPTKLENEKYYSIRSKFTAMLKTENLDYIKDLKSQGLIKNISAYLDELIESQKILLDQKKSPIR